MRTKKNENDHVLRPQGSGRSGWSKIHAVTCWLHRKPSFNVGLVALFVFLVVVVGCVTPTTPPADVVSPKPIQKIEELELQTILFNSSGHHQWSGLTLHGARLLAVADSKKAIYQLRLHRKGFEPVVVVKFKEFAGYKEYAYELRQKQPEVKKVVDPEGVSFCDEKYFVTNEVMRHLMIFDMSSKTFTYKSYDIEDMKLGVRNAGLEGVAVDCSRGLTVLAKEREPQKLFLFQESEKNQPTQDSQIVLPGSWRSGQVIISPVNEGQSMLHVGDNYAGLHLQWPYLYVLNRPNHTVVKYDLMNHKVMGRRSFFSALRTLYIDPYPFGLAEGLVMSDKRIFLVVDNNKLPLSKDGLKMGGKRNQSSMLIFDRGGF